ncbi:hypothetical protein [Streptococcus pneumoniae]|uniref:hypothetical protein n=1 Tax=Streptococcus pneumoniae TaxID=1313 RepID=UPI0005DE70A5|nr:hypothetical protein [Streptococcus pneumoniae]CGF04141.1 Uncharacterised protein [Streptococcus pneumoniae]CGF36642.1 Uncharacterised protein [Streptococcus pneumoniae]CIT27119.1 Uncharacterised protein [Streptococcus pneumoniae]CJP84080.1 Uncharacterised protein [Streptococcus pneumoniae]
MNTYKVIKIEETLIYLGKDDGTLLKVEQTSFNFVPQLGDIVEVYQSEGTYIITKKSSEVPTEQKKEEKGFLTVRNIKLYAWLGVFAILVWHPVFAVIPSVMYRLLKEKGEKDSATLILGATIFAILLSIIVRVLLTF